MRLATAVGAMAAAIFLNASADAQAPRRNVRCNATSLLNDETIRACTDFIGSGRDVGRALADLYVTRGRAYVARSQFDHAIADFSEALKNAPNHLLALHNRGNASLLKSDYDRAITDYTEAIWLAPRDVTLYQDRARAYESKAEYARAVEDYSEAIRIAPRLVAAYKARCIVRTIWGRELKQALDDCEEALRLVPNDLVTLERRGFTYLRLGNFDKAISDFNVVLRFAATNASALYGRGLAKKKKLDDVGGDADVYTAQQLRPDIVEQLIRYGFK